ncbi:MAG: hypothetical protein FDZ75_03520, partial [Actinobacteria bacterium]
MSRFVSGGWLRGLAVLACVGLLATGIAGCVVPTALDRASVQGAASVPPTEASPTPAAPSAPPPAAPVEEPAPAPAPAPKPAPAPALDLNLREAVVTRVVDGDTIHVRFSDDGATEKIRIIGVDTPEYTKEIEPYGAEASRYAQDRLSGRTVYLERDAELRDRYGRMLAYVWLSKPIRAGSDGRPAFAEVGRRTFEGLLLRHGYGQVMTIPPNVKYADYFVRMGREARDANRGLWGLSVGGGSSSSGGGAVSQGGSGSSAGSYIGNRNTMKFHIPT